jgi:hypothetical protein
LTPFLLKRVNEITGGKSLKANISLVHNNAEVGSLISVELSRLKNEGRFKVNKKIVESVHEKLGEEGKAVTPIGISHGCKEI